MATMIRARSVFPAGAALLLSAGVAAAAPAVVRADLNLRSGPGTGYAVVETIPGGATVDVLGCGGSWCRVAYGGETGYARRSYLGLGEAAVIEENAGPPPMAYGYPDYDEFYYYGYGPSVGVGVGVYTGDTWRDGGWRYGRNLRYDGTRYGGTRYGRNGNWAGRGGWQAGRTNAPVPPAGTASPVRTGENFGGRPAMGASPRGGGMSAGPGAGGGRAAAGGNAGVAGGGAAPGGPMARQ
jgi:hypothetical protein